MTVAIDYDGTMKSSAYYDREEWEMWRDLIMVLHNAGKTVIIATARRGKQHDIDEIEEYKTKMNLRFDVPVVYCATGYDFPNKRAACKAKGYTVDIIIEDMEDLWRGGE